MTNKLDLSALRGSIASLENATRVIQDTGWFGACDGARPFLRDARALLAALEARNA